MALLVVPAYALAWWLAGYLIGRDPRRVLLQRAAAALVAYAVAAVAWTLDPQSAVTGNLLCAPALLWAGVATALLPHDAPEHRQVNRGWLPIVLVFGVPAALLPGVGKLVALAPLVGALVLLLHYQERLLPRRLAAALVVAAALYALGLVVVLAPLDLGSPALVLAAIGLDQLLLGFVVAVAHAADAGERLVPDLRRSLLLALAATLLCAGPAAVTMLALPGDPVVTVLQCGLVAVVLGGLGAAGPLRSALDRFAHLGDERLLGERSGLLRAAEALPRRFPRARLATMDEEDFRRLTLRALLSYRDAGRLLRSPLVELPAVDRRLAARGPGLGDHPLVRVAELRALLGEQVERLKPAGGTGPSVGEEWRFYNAIHYFCVAGLRPYDRSPRTNGLDRETRRVNDWFRQYVPRHTLHRWQWEAAGIVAGRLWRDVVATDPRWFTGGAGAAPRSTTTRRR